MAKSGRKGSNSAAASRSASTGLNTTAQQASPGPAALAAGRRRPWLVAAAAVLLLALAAAWLKRPGEQHAAPAVGQAGGAADGAATVTLDTPVRLHGPVKKHGPLAMLSLLGKGAERSALVFPPAWRQQRLAGRKPPLPPLCTILWNDPYKLIFLKCAKNAGNSVAHYFGARFQGSSAPTALTVLEPLWEPRLVAQLLEKWDSYTVFTFVRHPLQRAFSQYAFLVPFMAAGDGCYVPWDDYCRDPLLLGDRCAARPQCCRRFNIIDQYFHLLPQASCLLTERGQLAVDFVGRVEFFDQDFAQLLAFLNAREGLPQVPVQAGRAWNANRLGPCQDDAAAARAARGAAPGGVPNPCNRSVLFVGPRARCAAGLAAFLQEDMRLLFSPP